MTDTDKPCDWRGIPFEEGTVVLYRSGEGKGVYGIGRIIRVYQTRANGPQLADISWLEMSEEFSRKRTTHSRAVYTQSLTVWTNQDAAAPVAIPEASEFEVPESIREFILLQRAAGTTLEAISRRAKLPVLTIQAVLMEEIEKRKEGKH